MADSDNLSGYKFCRVSRGNTHLDTILARRWDNVLQRVSETEYDAAGF